MHVQPTPTPTPAATKNAKSRGAALIERLGDLRALCDPPEKEKEKEADGAGDHAVEELGLLVDEPMSRHTTLRLGGPADLWARPRRLGALQRLLACAHTHSIPVTFVGSGTNLLVRDQGIRGLVINLGRLNKVYRHEPKDRPGDLEVEAGASTGKLLKQALQWSLGGIEFLGGVPGSVGGGLVMNAGTYLGEFTDVVTEVRSLSQTGALIRRDHDACGFRYRASDLPTNEIVIGASLGLQPRDQDQIKADVADLKSRRRDREPSGVANSGSTFKNPPGDYAGRLIESAGLKGKRVAGAFVSPKHANWLVVERRAPCRAADLLALIDIVRDEVAAKHGIHLDLELRVIGE
ncbi:MAG TPA: UDP-N-acetylmuramate dehydrogenase [Nannocystis exedens]|nr:UDP-N-acetylmuramate dehydrogenase [Nannocystis exedens]